MTHFEFISVAVSIVLSFAILRLLDGLPHAAARGKRYAIHAVWVVFLLLWTAIFWWLTWSHSARKEEFSFAAFLLLVIPPALFYLSATALVSHAPAAVSSWRQHFWNVRRRFFGVTLALLVSLVCTTLVLQAIPLSHPIRVPEAVLFGILVTGLLSESERTHGAIACVAAVLVMALLGLTLSGQIDLDLRH